jgi:hypothetical protein
MKRNSPLILLFFLAFTFFSCNKGTPASFWNKYYSHLLVEEINDQGPYGGHRAIYWKGDKENVFSATNVIAFANKNGWKLVDSSRFTGEQSNKWVYGDKPIFPLSHTGFSDSIKNNSTYQYFPRWFRGEVKLYKFKTGWVAIEPGSDNSNEENGFVLLSKDKNEMIIYHLWGQ